MLTKQEIFDKGVGAVLAQGRMSMQGGTCRYATNESTHCIVGCLVPHEVALAWDEFNGPAGFDIELTADLTEEQIDQVKSDLLEAGIDWEEQKSFLAALQATHDVSAGRERNEEIAIFRQMACEVSRDYDLEWKFD